MFCQFLDALKDVFCPPPKVRWRIGPVIKSTSVGPNHARHRHRIGVADMAFVLKDNEQTQVVADFRSAKGNPATVDGIPAWTVSDPATLSVTPAADGKSALVAAVGPAGTGQVSVSADADLGEGVKEVIGRLDIEIVGGEATVINLNPGPAVTQP